MRGAVNRVGSTRGAAAAGLPYFCHRWVDRGGGLCYIAGFQHVVAMFGATALAPLLMGFDSNVAIFFSGVATLLFFIVTRGQLPSYLGSSFAFIGV
ncbi:MAG: hypothetical protein B7Z14_19490, partial [Bosea sp. 32-68-6]